MAVSFDLRTLRRIGVLVISIVACGALGISQARQILDQREKTVALAKTHLENLALSLTNSLDGTFVAAEAALTLTAGLVRQRGIARSEERDFRETLAALAQGSRSMQVIRVLDANGDLLASSALEPARSINFADREGFVYHMGSPDLAPRIGLPTIGALSPNWVIPLSIRINDADGAFAGIVVLSIDMRFFQRQFDLIELGRDGAISLQNLKGVFLVRRPFSEEAIGRDASRGELFAKYLPVSSAGTYAFRASVDGRERFVSYRKSDNSPIVVAVAMSVDEILATWRADSVRDAWRTALGAMLLIGFALVVVAALNRLEREERAILAEQRLAKAIVDNAAQCIFVTDAKMRIVATNAAFGATTGYAVEDVVGRDLATFEANRGGDVSFGEAWRAARDEGRWSGDIWARRKNGEALLERLTVSTVAGEDGRPTHFVAMFADATALKAEEDAIADMANKDALTGLSNRRAGMARAAELIAEADTAGKQVAVMLLDLDRFKAINDTLGHAAGDAVLTEVAARLRRSTRDNDAIARLGGDEFLVALGDLDDSAAIRRMAARIAHALVAPIAYEGAELHIGCSIGVAMFPSDAAVLAELVEFADAAMYSAKAQAKASGQTQGGIRFHETQDTHVSV